MVSESNVSGSVQSSTVEAEQVAAFDRMIASPFFAGAGQQIELLTYLYENRGKRVKDADIAVGCLGLETLGQKESERIRKLCGRVRRALFDYAEVAEGDWRFSLPLTHGGGYQLSVRNVNATMEMDEKFWRAHLAPSRPIMLIYDEPLFYRDKEEGTVIRVPQMESGAGSAAVSEAAAELERRFRAEGAKPLEPCHLYMLSGEMGARDHIARWFEDNYATRVENKVSRVMLNISDFASYSPVIVGNVRTNKILREVTELHQYKRFGYFAGVNGWREVVIREFTERERDAVLERFNGKIEGNNIVLHDDATTGNVVFCIVTRLPNPYDKSSCVTILSASHTKVLETVANTLTNGQLLAEVFVNACFDPDKPFPRYFEGLFSIRLGPTGPDDKPTRPVLRCCRHFSSFKEEVQEINETTSRTGPA